MNWIGAGKRRNGGFRLSITHTFGPNRRSFSTRDHIGGLGNKSSYITTIYRRGFNLEAIAIYPNI